MYFNSLNFVKSTDIESIKKLTWIISKYIITNNNNNRYNHLKIKYLYIEVEKNQFTKNEQ